MSDPSQELSAAEIEREAAAELPERQAMSLVSTDPSAAWLSGYGDAAGGMGLTETAGDQTGAGDMASGTAGSATGMANDAAATDGGASGSEGGGLTDTDRSETYSQNDSATAVS